MSIHVAIVQPPYDRLILDGTKTVECRLTKNAMPPFGCVVPGERIYIKRSGGSFVGVAEVARVWAADRLTRRDVAKIRKRFDDAICGEAAYWKLKRDAAYATLVWLRDVRPCSLRPRYKTQNMRAWYTLPDSADPLADTESPDRAAAFEVELAAGALRQKSVRVTHVLGRFPIVSHGGATRADAGEPFELRLTGGPVIVTDIVAAKKLIRWRGWGGWFEQTGAKPGDRLRFTPCGPRAFAVRLVRSRV